MHAHGHGVTHVGVVGQQRGPARDTAREKRIVKLRAGGASIRVIAASVGLSTAGVLKVLRRQEQP